METSPPDFSIISSPNAIPVPYLQDKFEVFSVKPISPNTALELLAEQATQLKWRGPGGFNLLEDDGDLPDTSGFTCTHETWQEPTTSTLSPSLAPVPYSIPFHYTSSTQPSPPVAGAETIEPKRNLVSQAQVDPPQFQLSTPRSTAAPSPEPRAAIGLGIQLRDFQVAPGGQGCREAPCERVMPEPESRTPPVPPARRSNSSEKPPALLSHLKRGFYKCDWEGCSKEFKKPCLLKSHYCIHTNERPFSCALCSMCFIRGHDLKRHQRSVHSTGGRASVSCQHCGRTFTRLDSCKYHEATSCVAFLQKSS